MSESSATYAKWWDLIHSAGTTAMTMVEQQAKVVAPSERGALAEQARQAGRRMYYLADTLDLVEPE